MSGVQSAGRLARLGACADSLLFAARPCAGLRVALLALSLLSCRSQPKNDAPGPAPAVSAASKGRVVTCRETSGSQVVVLGTGEPPQELEEDGEVGQELPFSVELGAARPGRGRFGVAGLENRRGATFAFAAIVAGDGTGQAIELLRVFGDAEPPAVRAFEDGYLIAAASTDAAGPTLRLMRIDPPFSGRDVRRGEEVTGLRRDVSGFSLETAARRALLAFGKLEKGLGRVVVAAVDPASLTLIGAPRTIELENGLEAEAPQLVARQGGFYLAFVGRRTGALRLSAPALAPDADADAEAPVLESGPTALYVMPLDDAGVAVGSAREVSAPGAHVSAFEALPWGETQALLVYREDPQVPGLERPSAEAVLASADGSVMRRTWELGETSGLPSVLIDRARPDGAPPGWVLVHGDAEVRIGALSDDPLVPPVFVSDPVLRSSEPAALHAGNLLRARRRGLKIELDLVACELSAR